MPWCPVCKAEYRQGFHICPDCKIELVDGLQADLGQEKTIKTIERWVFLTGVTNDNEAEIIESLLRSNGIRLFKKYKGAGEILKIYVGMTNFGVDLFVPESQFEQARELVGDIPEKYNQADGSKSGLAASEKKDQRRKTQMTFILVGFIIMILIEIIIQFGQK